MCQICEENPTSEQTNLVEEYLVKQKPISSFWRQSSFRSDIDKNKNHYLYNYINSDFVIYAAPNNGPYEVIKFIYLNKKSISKK